MKLTPGRLVDPAIGIFGWKKLIQSAKIPNTMQTINRT